MKRLYSSLIVMVVFVLFAGLSGTAEAIDLRSWDQRIIDPARFLLRFGNTAVLDRETQLLWERNPDNAPRTWSIAQSLCSAGAVGDRRGWRLPTVQELASLVDPGNESPALPIGHPFKLIPKQEDGFFWSATTSASNTSDAWQVRFDVGRVLINLKSRNGFRWCVRGGQGSVIGGG